MYHGCERSIYVHNEKCHNVSTSQTISLLVMLDPQSLNGVESNYKLTDATLQEFFNFTSDSTLTAPGNSVDNSRQAVVTTLAARQKMYLVPPLLHLNALISRQHRPLSGKHNLPVHSLLTLALLTLFLLQCLERKFRIASLLRLPTAPICTLRWDTSFRPSNFYSFRHDPSRKDEWRLPEICTNFFFALPTSHGLDKHPDV